MNINKEQVKEVLWRVVDFFLVRGIWLRLRFPRKNDDYEDSEREVKLQAGFNADEERDDRYVNEYSNDPFFR